jgi:hypothetical protein
MERTIWQVAGETLREIGILRGVFFMLDDIMAGGVHFSLRIKLLVLVASSIVVILGIWMECRRPGADE